MKNPQLGSEERELLASIEAGEWESVPDVQGEIERHRQAARTTLRKDRRVNIRISSKDLEDIRTLAVEDGIPYQTLIASVLHRYVTGRLIEPPRPGRLNQPTP